MRARRLQQVRDAGLRAGEGGAGVDRPHEVEALQRRLEGAGQADGAGVVDQHVDAAEGGDGLLDGALDLRLVADVGGDRQGAAARALDLLGRGVDGARELRVRLGGLGGDHDVGAVRRGPEADRQADAAARAGDEQGLAFEIRHARLPLAPQVGRSILTGPCAGNPRARSCVVR